MEIGVVSGSVCWRKMSWGKRKCAGEAPGKENEAWKGCGRWFRSGIIEMWTLGSCKGGVLPSPSCKHSLIKFSSLKLVDMKHSRKEQPSSELACPSPTVMPQSWTSGEGFWNPAAISAILGLLEASGAGWHGALQLSTCQNGSVAGWDVRASLCWDPAWTSALGGYFGGDWISHRLLELGYHKASEEMIASHQLEFLNDWRSKSPLFHVNFESNQMHMCSRCIYCRCIFLMLSSLLSMHWKHWEENGSLDKGLVISFTLHTA